MTCLRKALAIVLPFAALALGIRPVRGQSLSQATAYYKQLDYQHAAETAQSTLALGGHGPKALVQIYELLARAYASQGQASKAQRAFRHLLLLRPQYQLPQGVSPKLRLPFEAARGRTRKELGLQVSHSPPTRAPCDRPLHLVVKIEGNPLRMVHAVRVVYRLPGARLRSQLWSRASAGAMVFSVPLNSVGGRPGQLEYRVEILDDHENFLRRLGTATVPLRIKLVAAAQPMAKPSISSGTIAWVGGSTAAALAVATVVFAVLAKRAESDLNAELDTFPAVPAAVEDARDRTRAFSVTTDVLGVTTLAIAAGTTLWAILAAKPERRTQRSARLMPPQAGSALSYEF